MSAGNKVSGDEPGTSGKDQFFILLILSNRKTGPNIGCEHF